MRRVHEAQARRANAQAEGKHRSGDRHERVIRKVPFRLVHKLVDPDSAAPGQAITVSRLQGSEADLKALLTVARHDELSSALQAFDAAVHRFADLEDSAGGCLCWATPAPDLSEHPLWAEVAAYNQYYHTSSLRFVASPNDDYPTEVIISGEASEVRQRAGSGDSNMSGGVLAAPTVDGELDAPNDTQGLVAAADVHVGLMTPPVSAAPARAAATTPAEATVADQRGAGGGAASDEGGAGQDTAGNADGAQPGNIDAAVAARDSQRGLTGDSEGVGSEGGVPSTAPAAGVDPGTAPVPASAAGQARTEVRRDSTGHNQEEAASGVGAAAPDGATADEPASAGTLGENAVTDAGLAVAPVAISKEERDAAWLAANKERAERQAAAAAAERQAKLDAMDEEERVRFLADEAAKAEKEARHDRMLKRQMGAYSKSKKKRLLKAKGRGRGRGRGR